MAGDGRFQHRIGIHGANLIGKYSDSHAGGASSFHDERNPLKTIGRRGGALMARLLWAISWLVLAAGTAHGQGRILATGGVTEIEGAGGGGIVPWALIAGYGTQDEIGVTASTTYLDISDFRLQSASVAVGLHDRVEVSLARQRFGLGSTVPGHSIQLDIVGLKMRAFGDAVYDQDRWLPQIALGLQYKHNRDYDFIPKAIGASNGTGTDFYVAATKLFLAGAAGRNVLLNATMRATKANQLGILGFGGDLNDRYRLVFEGSAALFLTDRIGVGYEYRQKPNNLSAFREQAYQDVFVAWLPNKHVALTVAWAKLGQIADKKRQDGLYLAGQLGF